MRALRHRRRFSIRRAEIELFSVIRDRGGKCSSAIGPLRTSRVVAPASLNCADSRRSGKRSGRHHTISSRRWHIGGVSADTGDFRGLCKPSHGTALFAKVARIVIKWCGRPTNKEVLPQMIDDTIYAWRTGQFEGISVFRAEDPGGPTLVESRSAKIELERTAGCHQMMPLPSKRKSHRCGIADRQVFGSTFRESG